MKLSIAIAFILGLIPLHASTLDEINLLMKNQQMSLYKVKSKDSMNHNGIGLFYNTQKVKLKMEGSDTSFKTGALVTVNPFQTPMYVNIGANYLDETIQDNDLITNNVSQYSTALALGYMFYDNLYFELGGGVSQLNGYPISTDNTTNSLTSKDTYLQIGKRFETPIGIVDTNFKGSQIYKALSTKEENYESSFNYHLNDAIKVDYLHSMNQNIICDRYSINYNYFTTGYTNNISQDSYDIRVGIKANFTDITDFSSYKPPIKAKLPVSKSHKFDTMILHDNMHPRL